MCLDSCYQIIVILECLQEQGLLGSSCILRTNNHASNGIGNLESFLIFDLEALAVSTINILIATTLNASMASTYFPLFQRSCLLFEELSRNGNRIATLEISELQHIEKVLSTYIQPDSDGAVAPESAQPQASQAFAVISPGADVGMPIANQDVMEAPLSTSISNMNTYGDGFDGGFSTVQIMDLADAIDVDFTDWM